MIQHPVSFMTNRKDLFRQSQCATCHGFFYDDEMEHDDKGSTLCRHCYINTFVPKRGLVSKLNAELPWGMNLFEMLAVIGIMAVLVGIVVPNVIKMRRDAEERGLLNLYYMQEGSQISAMANQVVTAYEEGEDIQDIVANMPQLSDISDEELQQLETELSALAGMDQGMEELKLAKAMRALMGLQWYRDELEQIE